MEQTTRHIGLVDDHSLFRSGIAKLLLDFSDIVIDFEAANGKELQKTLPGLASTTQVILMDITMPGMDGYAATQWVRDNYPHIHIIALSMYEDEAAIIRMLRAGAEGYVFKESRASELHRAIVEVIEHGYFMNNQVSGKLIRSLNRRDGAGDTPPLTDKEKEFLVACASEDTYKEIAAKMGVATRTVDNYRESLFEKLQIRSRVGLVLFAIKNGYVKI